MFSIKHIKFLIIKNKQEQLYGEIIFDSRFTN